MKKLALAALAAIALSGFTYKANHNTNKTISGFNVASNWGAFLPGVQSVSRYVLLGTEFVPGSLVCASTNGQYKLWYQTDGNLVLYKLGGIPLWASGPVVTGATKVVFATDGNVIAYKNGTNVYWQSNTGYAYPVPVPLPLPQYWALQDDGNFVRYWGTPGNPDLTAPSISTRTSGGVNSPNYGSFQ
jgi:hypothetical protein